MKTLRLRRIWPIRLLVGTAIVCAACAAEKSDSRHATSSVASADGVTIAYDVAGDGTPALVFVHGWSCDRTYWQEQLEPFSRDFTVVAVDLAGHGESGLERDTQTIEAFGGDVAAVVERIGLERAVLIGHSMGGDVIIETARQLPGRVVGLVWIDTYKQLPILRTDEELERRLAPFHANFVETTRDVVRGMFSLTADSFLIERVAADMSAAPPEIAVPALMAAFRFAYEVPSALEELELPVVAINPDNEPTDIASMARHGVEVVVMPGVGHFPMIEDPMRFNQTLANVIERFAR